MIYQLNPIIPSLVNTGLAPLGVKSSAGSDQIVWKDASDVVHVLFNWFVDGWYGIHINTDTGVATLVTGCPSGKFSGAVHFPTNDKIYSGAGYVDPDSGGVYSEFDPATGINTVIKSGVGVALNNIVGDDGLLYFSDGSLHSWSYNPTTDTWVDYGVKTARNDPWTADTAIDLNAYRSPIDQTGSYDYECTARTGTFKTGAIEPTWPTILGQTVVDNEITWTCRWAQVGDINYTYIATDSTYHYKSVQKYGGTQEVYYCLIGDVGNWSKWALVGDSGSIYHLRFSKDNAGNWFAWGPVGGSLKCYSFSGGTTTEISAPTNGACSGPPRYLGTLEDDYAGVYGYEFDIDRLNPIPVTQNYSRIGYKIVGAGSYTYVNSATFTDYMSEPITNLAFTDPSKILGICYQYFTGSLVNLGTGSIEGLSGPILSCYGTFNHSSGEIYFMGYSNIILRYDPTQAWDLVNSTSTPCLPGDATSNPYYILLQSPTVHYRTFGAEDCNGLMWFGGNTTRVSPANYGVVCWYDPADGSGANVWGGGTPPNYGQDVHSLISANNGTVIVFSDNLGNIWFIDSATKTLDETPLIPIADTECSTIMVEIFPDIILGIVMGTGFNKVIKFEASTKEILYLEDYPVVGEPFGFPGTIESNYKVTRLIKGPDGYAWIVSGHSATKLYRINPFTCAFTEIASTGNYSEGRLAFDSNTGDLLNYGHYDTTTYQTLYKWPLMLHKVTNRIVNGISTNNICGSSAEKINGIQQ